MRGGIFLKGALCLAAVLYGSFAGMLLYSFFDYQSYARASYAITECKGGDKFARLTFSRRLKLVAAYFVDPDTAKGATVLYALSLDDLPDSLKRSIDNEEETNPAERKMLTKGMIGMGGFIMRVVEDRDGKESLYCFLGESDSIDADVLLKENRKKYIYANIRPRRNLLTFNTTREFPIVSWEKR